MFEYLRQCRQLLETAQKGRKTGFLGLGKPKVDIPLDFFQGQIDFPTAQTFGWLLKEGRVVWGAVTQANANAFVPSRTDVPGNTIFSPDPYFDDRPDELLRIAGSVSALKNATNVPAEFAGISALITDEKNFAINAPLPPGLTGGRQVFFTTTNFYRRSLPNTVLSDGLIPLLILPERTTANLLLPLAFWSPGLVTRWNGLFREAAFPDSANSSGIGETGPPDEGEVSAYLANPIQLTTDAVIAARGFINQIGTTDSTFLWVSFRDGLYNITMVDKPFPEVPFPVVTESSGIGIVISGTQAAFLEGMTIGFFKSSVGNGFTFD
jgi:Fe-S cluster assembly iron-binding protein IscA